MKRRPPGCPLFPYPTLFRSPERGVAYVRDVPVEATPPPITASGPIGWLRANFFATPFDMVLTVAMLLLLAWIVPPLLDFMIDRKSTRLNSSHANISYAVFCL